MLLFFLVSKLPTVMSRIQAIPIFFLSVSLLILAYAVDKVMSLENDYWKVYPSFSLHHL